MSVKKLSIVCILIFLIFAIVVCRHEIIRKYKIHKTCKLLEKNSQTIREELDRLSMDMLTNSHRRQHEWGVDKLQEISKLHASKTGWVYAWSPHSTDKNNEWLNFGLVVGSKSIGLNSNLCPKTVAVLKQLPVNVLIAGFSLMRPHSVIHKHQDENTPDNVTIHLGVDVPSPHDCVLSVQTCNGDITNTQEENGKAFTFDSRQSHWAVNFSAKNRIVLYLDVDTSPKS